MHWDESVQDLLQVEQWIKRYELELLKQRSILCEKGSITGDDSPGGSLFLYCHSYVTSVSQMSGLGHSEQRYQQNQV